MANPSPADTSHPPSYRRNRSRSLSRDSWRTSPLLAGPSPVTRGRFSSRSMPLSRKNGTRRSSSLCASSGESKMIRPQLRLSTARICRPPPALIMACSQVGVLLLAVRVLASARRSSSWHSASVRRLCTTAANMFLYSGMGGSDPLKIGVWRWFWGGGSCRGCGLSFFFSFFQLEFRPFSARNNSEDD